MKFISSKVKQFLADEEGASAVEYGLFVALIAAVIVVAVQTLGTRVNTAFGNVNAKLPTQ